jgi:hypothetical protein
MPHVRNSVRAAENDGRTPTIRFCCIAGKIDVELPNRSNYDTDLQG